MTSTETPWADVRAALIRIAREHQPIKTADLCRKASRETRRMTPIAFSEMQDLIGEGFLVSDENGMVTLADPWPEAAEETSR